MSASIRLPLQALLLIHSAWLAVRAFFVAVDGETQAEVIARAIVDGELGVARAYFDSYAGTETGQGPDNARRGAALALVSLIDIQSMLARSREPKEFWAHVELLGHRNLGLCWVTEARLASVDVLRAQEANGTTHWIRATSIYRMTVVPAEWATKQQPAAPPADPPASVNDTAASDHADDCDAGVF